jgi:SAM-dependent methyltransferase
MNNFWDQRYSTEEYAYGEKPNQFIQEELAKLNPGRILFPAEGEGRNAVFAADQGWQVWAFDPSTEGRKKALQLAGKHNVEIDYRIATYENMDYPKNFFDCIVLVFAHMAPHQRNRVHQKLAGLLKPGGHLILEGFSKEQLNYPSGGPRNYDMLFSEEELQHDFSGLSKLSITKTETYLEEGLFHQGPASVIRVFGVR